MFTHETAEQFAENMARVKRGKNLSLTVISQRAGIHRTHVGLLLRGKRTAQIDTLVKLAAALEVSPGDLLKGVTWEADGHGSGVFRRGGPEEKAVADD